MYDKCIEISVPWADLHIEPDTSLEILAVFGDHGKYRSYVPENKFIKLQAPWSGAEGAGGASGVGEDEEDEGVIHYLITYYLK